MCNHLFGASIDSSMQLFIHPSIHSSTHPSILLTIHPLIHGTSNHCAQEVTGLCAAVYLVACKCKDLTRDALKVVCQLYAPILWLQLLILHWQHFVFYDHVLDDTFNVFQNDTWQNRVKGFRGQQGTQQTLNFGIASRIHLQALCCFTLMSVCQKLLKLQASQACCAL